MTSSIRTVDATTSAHVQGVNATSGGLVAATIGAALVAGAILTFAWLPAEYGIDPTGVGHVLGLTEMGHIKEQLHADADADAAAALAASSSSSNVDITQKLDAIQMQLATLTAAIGANLQSANAPISGTQAELTQGADAKASISQAADTQLVNLQAVSTLSAPESTPAAERQETTAPADVWQDELEYILTPGEGIEIKLVMKEGALAEYEWSANGAVLNHDTHGDGGGQGISYEKGRSIPEQAGELVAAFAGNHGWFWRNRTADDVVLTLRTRGDYTGMVLP